MIPVSEAQKPRTVTITVPYVGSAVSVNHYTGRTRDGRVYVVPEAKAFKVSIGWLLKTYHLEDWKQPLTVVIGGRFKNLGNCPDLHNLSKLVCDGIEEITGINDRDFKVETQLPTFNKLEEPIVIVTVKEA